MRILSQAIKFSWAFIALIVCHISGFTAYTYADSNNRPRVVLITSLAVDLPTLKATLPKKSVFRSILALADEEFFRSYLSNITSIFQRKFQIENNLDVDLAVIHHANAHDISTILKSDRNVAVIYLAHAGFLESPEKTGLANVRFTISDELFNDVKEAFYNIHPNLKFLAFVGCNTQKIVDAMRSQGYFSRNEDLRIFATEKNTDAKHGLGLAINEAIRVLQSSRTYASTEVPQITNPSGIRLRITRRTPNQLPANQTQSAAVMVTLGRQLIATFPPKKAGQTQTQTAWVDIPDDVTPSDLKIIVSSGHDPLLGHPAPELGEFQFEVLDQPLPLQAEWTPFSFKGAPVGSGFHVYRYSGQVPIVRRNN